MTTAVQLDMEWPATVRELVSGGKFMQALNELLKRGTRPPDDLLSAASAMLTASTEGAHMYTVSRYLNRVRITAHLKRPLVK